MDMDLIAKAATGVAIMIVLDVVAGITSAASRGDLDSTKLRQGLMHKMGLVLAFALAVAVELEATLLGIGMGVPMVAPVASYIVLMEACSVYENVRDINPDFQYDGLASLFRDKGDGEKDE